MAKRRFDTEDWVEQNTPGTNPPAGFLRLYAKPDHHINTLDSTGLEQTVALRQIVSAASATVMFGDSLLAGGGAWQAGRAWQYLFEGMTRGQMQNFAKGGAVASWHHNGVAAVGDGGWPAVFSYCGMPEKMPFWKGAYSAVTTYNYGDGVINGGSWWVALGTSTGVTPVEGTSWHQITAVSDYGATVWNPLPYIPILCFGNNDLGWGKDLTVFLETMRSMIARLSSGRVFEDSDGTIAYSGGFAAAVFPNTGPSGVIKASGGPRTGSYRVIPNTLNETVTISVPPDFPGGEIDLGFVVGPSATGSLEIKVDGNLPGAGFTLNINGASVGTGILNAASPNRVSTAGGATQDNAIVARLTGLSSGAHTIVVKVTATPVANIRFDYWQVRSLTPPPIIVCNLIRELSYLAWTSPYPTDSDVNTWNAGLAALCGSSGEFPNAILYDMDASLNKQTKYWSTDLIHPNEAGHRKIAGDLFELFDNISASTDTVAAISSAPQISDLNPTVKAPCMAASVVAVNVNAFSGGTLDGYTLYPGDRILLLGQAANDNGIWMYNGSGPLLRPPDYAPGSFQKNVMTTVLYGNTWSGMQAYIVSPQDGVIVGKESHFWWWLNTGAFMTEQASAPINPPNGLLRVWADNTNHLHTLDSSGVDHDLTADSGGGSSNMVALAEIILAGSQATIDFQNIPQTYRHLQIWATLRTDRAASDEGVQMNINNDSTVADYYQESNFEFAATYFNGEILGSANSRRSAYATGASAPSGHFAQSIIDIPDYAGANRKVLRTSGAYWKALATSGILVYNFATGWNNGSAITRLTFLSEGGANFVAGSKITIYGLSGPGAAIKNYSTRMFAGASLR